MLNDDLKSYILASLRDTSIKRYKFDKIYLISGLIVITVMLIAFWWYSFEDKFLFSVMPMFTLLSVVELFKLFCNLISLDSDYKSGIHYLYEKGKLVSVNDDTCTYIINSGYEISFPIIKRVKKRVIIEFKVDNFDVISGKIFE